jgi:hypothetical protein
MNFAKPVSADNWNLYDDAVAEAVHENVTARGCSTALSLGDVCVGVWMTVVNFDGAENDPFPP